MMIMLLLVRVRDNPDDVAGCLARCVGVAAAVASPDAAGQNLNQVQLYLHRV